MAETVTVKYDTFRAVVILDALPLFSSDKFRRLMRLMAAARWENIETLETMAHEIPERRAKAKVEYDFALKKRELDWQYIFPPKRRQPGDDKIRAENRSLDRKVQECRALLKNWTRIETIFKGEINI